MINQLTFEDQFSVVCACCFFMQLGINGSPWTCLGPHVFQKHQNSVKQHVTQAFPSDMPYARKFPLVLKYGLLI
jgi:hypothetical protein